MGIRNFKKAYSDLTQLVQEWKMTQVGEELVEHGLFCQTSNMPMRRSLKQNQINWYIKMVKPVHKKGKALSQRKFQNNTWEHKNKYD